jgi:predicted regulator of Ras-like GTPase activity (Roadblock/LC7/MglB family)
MPKPKKEIDALLAQLADEVPGVLALAVVDFESATAIASLKKGTVDPELAAAYNREVLSSKFKAIKALNLKSELMDVLITLSDQIHLIKPSADKSYFLYAAISSDNASLGIVRSVCNKYLGLIA